MSKEIFTLGSIFKEKREKRGISIDEVERRTFIPKRYLKAIESNEFSIFPTRSSITQMIRLYARFLELKDHEIANIIREFNYNTPLKFILFGKDSLVYIILLLVLLVISLFVLSL